MAEFKSVLIKDIQLGKNLKIEGEMMIQEKLSEASKKLYLTVNLHDKAGDAIFMNIFPSSPFYNKLSQFEVVYGEVSFKASKNGEFTNFSILGFEEKEKPVISPFKVDVLTAKLKEHINTIANKELRDIAVNLFKVPGLVNKMFIAPANTENGYAFETGLLVHTVRMMDIAESLVGTIQAFDQYKVEGEKHNSINIDMLKIAILLHDIGKLDAIEKKMYKIDKTLNGTLFEDAYLSMVMAEKLVAESNLNQEQMQLLLHVIGAAKGSTSFGAIHTARTLEAHVLAFIDKLDYHLALFEDLHRNAMEDVEIVKTRLNQKQLVLTSFNDVTPTPVVEESTEVEEQVAQETNISDEVAEDLAQLTENEVVDGQDESIQNKEDEQSSVPSFDPFDLVEKTEETVEVQTSSNNEEINTEETVEGNTSVKEEENTLIAITEIDYRKDNK